MAVNSIHKTDVEIISLLKAGTSEGWEHLYNKYSPLMYGTIMKAVNFDKTAANEMLVQTFFDLKKSNFFLTLWKQSLSLFLVQHCYQVMSRSYKTAPVITKQPTYCADTFPTLQTTLKNKLPLKIIAAKLGITQALVMVRLRSELKEARKRFPATSHDLASMTYKNTGENS